MAEKAMEARWAALERRGIVAELALERETSADRRATLMRGLRRTRAALFAVSLAAFGCVVLLTLHWQVPLHMLGVIILFPVASTFEQWIKLCTADAWVGPQERLAGTTLPLAMACLGVFFAIETGSVPLALAWLLGVAVALVLVRRADRLASALGHIDFDRRLAPPPTTLRGLITSSLGQILIWAPVTALFAFEIVLAPALVDTPPTPARVQRALALEGVSEAEVERFLERYREAWNGRDLDGLFDLRTPSEDLQRSWTGGSLERLAREPGGWPALDGLALRGSWGHYPAIREVEIVARAGAEEFRAGLHVGPDGIHWR